jgi:diguanylate cyclase (GGDEF)-like protein
MIRQLDAAERILRPLSDLIGKPLRIATPGFTGEETLIRVAPGTILSSDETLTIDERRLISEILEFVRHADEQGERIRDLEGQVGKLAGENMQLAVRNQLLQEASAHDALTGLYNRPFVIDKIESEINRSLRNGSPMALLMLDIDHFKDVNDTYGHMAGDQVLQVVARLIKECLRVYDIPGRYGGEEFCVLLPDMALPSMPTVAERIRRRLETTTMDVTGASLIVTASIGIAGIDVGTRDPVLSPAALIDRADRALYMAKHEGRNRVAVWDSGEPRPIEHEH